MISRLFLLALPVVAAGCLHLNTSYTPTVSPRLAYTVQEGQAVLVRDGKEFPVGPLGDGLDVAVAGVPEAEKAAQEFEDGMTRGIAISTSGLAILTGGVIASAVFPGAIAPMIAMGVGLVVDLGGAISTVPSSTRATDAVNIYNDTVTQRATAPASSNAEKSAENAEPLDKRAVPLPDR